MLTNLLATPCNAYAAVTISCSVECNAGVKHLCTVQKNPLHDTEVFFRLLPCCPIVADKSVHPSVRNCYLLFMADYVAVKYTSQCYCVPSFN